MTSVAVPQRYLRDKRRHMMYVLRWELDVRLCVIADAARMTLQAVEYQVHSHFAEHCAVCKESVTSDA